MPENMTVARCGARASDFIRSSSVLCQKHHDGWLPSACLLLGFACELMAKSRLLRDGVTEKALRNTPYGHDISVMWRCKTTMFEEAEQLVAKLKLKPNPNGVTENFDWGIHFDQLAVAHSREDDYSLRYHNGEIHFADPKAVTIILGGMWRAEYEKA